MATVTDRGIVDRIIEANGVYPGDEDRPIDQIIEYTDGTGQRVWGLVYQYEIHRYGDAYAHRYLTDPNCREAVTIFTRPGSGP